MATTTSLRRFPEDATPTATLLRRCAGLATTGAAGLHVDAALDHRAHAAVAGFFVVAAAAQLALAGALVAGGSRRAGWGRAVTAAAVAVNAGLVVTWALSRTVGLGFVPDGQGREVAGWGDVTATTLEVAALLALGLAALGSLAGAGRVGPRAGRGLVLAAAVLVAGVSVPTALAGPGTAHGHAGGVGATSATGTGAGHGHGRATGTEGGGEAAAGQDGEKAAGRGPGHGHEPAPAAGRPAGSRLGLVGVHDHAGAVLPAADEHAARGPEGTAGGLSHLHASVTPGPARSHAGHDLGGTAHAPGAPALPDPLAGPGTISTLRIGPIPLPPTVPGVEVPHLSPALPFVGPGRVNLLPLAGLPAPCRECLVLGIRPGLVYADGTPANLDTGPMLHHAVFTEPARPDPVCGRDTLIGQLGHRVFAVGNERTGASLPEGFGVPLGSGPWAGVVELMNGSTELRTVFVEATVRWVPRGTPGIEPVTPVWLDVDSCGDSEVDVGAGPTDIDWEWPSTVTGRIVAAAGHLHDGGTWLGLRNASTGEHVCTSVAGYGTDPAYAGSLESMSACAWDRLGTVRSGERLHLRAHYNAASARPGVMGIMLVFVHETGDLAAGTPSPYPADPPPDGRPVDTGHAH